MDKVEASRSSRFEKSRFNSLPPSEKFRYFVSLFGAAGLIALSAVGCGNDSSKTNDKTSSTWGGNSPTLSDGAEKNTPAPGSKEKAEETELPSGTAVGVELYSPDGSGDIYVEEVSFGEMKELCEEQRQEMIQEAEVAGAELIGGPIVTMSYSVIGDNSLQGIEYSCGAP